MLEPLYYICDLRRDWLRNPYVTFWRPADAGYTYPLAWAGQYTLERLQSQPGYYWQKLTKTFARFPILCSEVERIAIAPRPKTIDGDTGPVVWMNKDNRAALRAAMLPPPSARMTTRQGE
jgi:hypothetical protein